MAKLSREHPALRGSPKLLSAKRRMTARSLGAVHFQNFFWVFGDEQREMVGDEVTAGEHSDGNESCDHEREEDAESRAFKDPEGHEAEKLQQGKAVDGRHGDVLGVVIVGAESGVGDPQE